MKTRNIDKDGFEQDPSYAVRLTADQWNQVGASLIMGAIAAAEDEGGPNDLGNDKVIRRSREVGRLIAEQLSRIDPDADEDRVDWTRWDVVNEIHDFVSDRYGYDEAGDTQ